jgi:hypothetical protein
MRLNLISFFLHKFHTHTHTPLRGGVSVMRVPVSENVVAECIQIE